MTTLITVMYVMLGVIIGSFFCLIPALHIYNVAGFALLIWVYVSAQILLIGAYLTEAIEFRYISKVTGSEPWKMQSPQKT